MLPHLLHNAVNLQMDNFRFFKTVIVNNFDGYAVFPKIIIKIIMNEILDKNIFKK